MEKRGFRIVEVVTFSLFLVVLLVSMLVSMASVASAATGCFTEPSFPNICTVIDESSALNFCNAAGNPQECMDKYFFVSVSCSDVSVCAFSPGTWCGDSCQQVDRQAQCVDRLSWINQTTTPDKCKTGCVICDRDASTANENVCEFGLNQIQATNKCKSLVGYRVGLFDTTFTSVQCTNSCSSFASPPGTVFGVVRDANNNLLSAVAVNAFTKSNVSDANGAYHLNDVSVGDVVIEAKKDGFKTERLTVKLLSGEQKQVNIVMQVAGSGIIKGSVRDNSGNPITSAKVVASGASGAGHGQAVSDSNGNYRMDSLQFGSYVVEASKSGFQTNSKNAAVNASEAVAAVDFTLASEQEVTITGQVTNQAGAAVAFAQIFVNGAFSTHTASSGFYTISVFADDNGESYSISAAKSGHVPSDVKNVVVKKGETKVVNFVLTSLLPECQFPVAKKVVNFAANHVTGEEVVKLTWQKPCPEVKGYVINRSEVVQGAGPLTQGKSEQIAFLDVAQGVIEPTSYPDDNVTWGRTYNYTISALYTDGERDFRMRVLQL